MAALKAVGKYPVDNVVLKISLSLVIASIGRDCRIVLFMPLFPGQVFLRDLIIFMISLLVKGWVRKLSGERRLGLLIGYGIVLWLF